MEWDVGLPWYRPTRILHVTSGADFGFREGSSKWPEYYPDSLPGIVDVGLGSPTGAKFGTRSNFPEQYQKAFFAMDWTFGRIIAVHLKPDGSSYSGNFEDFLKGKGMPVADLEFGPDGAMYFVVGGRGTQAGLYRVSYVGSSDGVVPRSAASVPMPEDPAAAKARALRRQLEAFHGKADPQAVDTAWPHLDSGDRFLRFAARTAIESQPVSQWRQRALAEKQARPGLEALLALTRVGTKEDQADVLKALGQWPLSSLDEPLKLHKLRVIEVSFSRHGRPDDELVKLATEKLSKSYPAETFPLNRELSQILVWLKAPGIVEKTLELMEKAEKQEEQIWYAYVLREADGWTPEQRTRYFAWFNKARSFRGGNSLAKFVTKIKELALEKVSEQEKVALTAVLQPQAAPVAPVAPPGPARAFVKAWAMADLVPALDQVARGRDFGRGKEIFNSVQCRQCHLFGPEGGGNMGPDLTAVASRFNRRDLLEAIIDPSKGISEQYASFLVTTKEGQTHMGLIVEQNKGQLTLVTDPLAGTRVSIPEAQVKSREMSPVSLMPPGLINVLKQEEILDLLAYIESGGNEKSAHFLPAK
jgi:putative heme-binding domain-containing protein